MWVCVFFVLTRAFKRKKSFFSKHEIVACFFDVESLVSATICEHAKVIIRCVTGGHIRVVSASYGRHDRVTCSHPSIRTTSCHAANSLAIVKSKCSGKTSCELHASNGVFGDPCVGTFKYLEVKYQCTQTTQATICEHHRKTLSCPYGRKINVLEASYGRRDRHTCPHPSIQTTNCHAANSISTVKSKCNNKSSCSLYASNSVFGDPCWGTYKYLRVKYHCI